MNGEKRLAHYREFVYEVGCINTVKGKTIDPEILKNERKKDFSSGTTDRFLARSRYFTDSGVIGSR